MFGRLVDAGLSGEEPPGQDAFPPIWDAWNGRTPENRARDSIAVNEVLVRRLEALDDDQIRSFHVSAFNRDLDLAGVLWMRLSEHAVHVWDIDVTFDPGAPVAADAVLPLLDGLPNMAARVGKPTGSARTVHVSTSDPERQFSLVTDGVRLEPWTDPPATGTLQLPAEALLRLVYGHLDVAHMPSLHLGAYGEEPR